MAIVQKKVYAYKRLFILIYFCLGFTDASSVLYYPIEDFVSFHLYTRNNYNNSAILNIYNNKKLAESHFNQKHTTKVLIHGWLSSEQGGICQDIKNNMLDVEDYNIICVDWSKISKNINYPVPVLETRNVGEFVAKFVDFLVDKGSNIKNIQLMGHSLGAHICGIAGSRLKSGKVCRIAGMDPALPGFAQFDDDKNILDPSDADFVDIIHSCAGGRGILKSAGHVDFFPNGGSSNQPGCNGIQAEIEGCSHSRAWQYYAKSLKNRYEYIAKKCDSWHSYLKGDCENNQIALMGEYVNTTMRGNFYLKASINK